MNNMKKFIASSELFSGFEIVIDVNYHESIESIVEFFRNELINLFNENNLVNLSQKAKDSKFHIHTNSLEEILISNASTIYYICDHC